MITHIDRDLLARFQHSYVRLFNAQLYGIADQEEHYGPFLDVLEDIQTFESGELQALAVEAQLGKHSTVLIDRVDQLELRGYVAKEELLKISRDVCGDMFPLVSHKIH